MCHVKLHGEFIFEVLEAWEGQKEGVFEGQRLDMVKMSSGPKSRFGRGRVR